MGLYSLRLDLPIVPLTGPMKVTRGTSGPIVLPPRGKESAV